MSNEAEMRWVSVKDRLPQIDEPVLIYGHIMVERDRCMLCAVSAIGDEYYDEDTGEFAKRPHWCWNDDKMLFVDGDNVTHWMPLPAPPTTQDNEKPR